MAFRTVNHHVAGSSPALGSAIYTLQRVLQNPLVKIHEIPTQDDRIINNASIRETR